MSAKNIFDQISKDLVTCTECLQILHPLLNVRGAEVLNGTQLANVTLRVRDSVLHEAILCLARILDKKSTDCQCIEKLIVVHSMEQSRQSKSLKKLEGIRHSQEWLDLRKIRHGRIAHNLNNRGAELSLKQITIVRDKLLQLFVLISSDKELLKKHDDHKKFWNGASKQFWHGVFSEAQSKR